MSLVEAYDQFKTELEAEGFTVLDGEALDPDHGPDIAVLRLGGATKVPTGLDSSSANYTATFGAQVQLPLEQGAYRDALALGQKVLAGLNAPEGLSNDVLNVETRASLVVLTFSRSIDYDE